MDVGKPFAGRTCFYFGTFNPIHTGHLMIAQAVLKQFSCLGGLDSVTFIPAGQSPLRSEEPDMLDARRRLRMVRLATAEHPAFQVSDIELGREGCSYTVETIRQLIAAGHAKAPVPIIIGSDALAGLPRWHEPQALIELACFLQAPRPDAPFIHAVKLNGQEVRLNTQPVEMPLLAISSTWIRQQLKAGQASGLRYFLPEPVRRYIVDNNLYR